MGQRLSLLVLILAFGTSACGKKKNSGDDGSAPSGSSHGVQTVGAATGTGSEIPTDLPDDLLPAGSPFRLDISTAPIDPNSATYLATLGLTTTLHANFGNGTSTSPIGYPYSVVSSSQGLVPIHFVAHPEVGGYTEPPYPKQSVAGPLPIPPNALPLGGLTGTLDRSIIVFDRDADVLYELYRCFPNADGSWDLLEASKFDLSGSTIVATGSLSAAGTPKLPGMVRYDEAIEKGVIDHAIAIAVSKSQAGFVAPAVRSAGSGNHDASFPPMGTRLRLKSDFDVSGFPASVQAILSAAKKYGFIVDDNGVSGFVTGTHDPRWNDGELANLRKVTFADFDVVEMGAITSGF